MRWGRALGEALRHQAAQPSPHHQPHLGTEADTELDWDKWKHFELGKVRIDVLLM